MLWVYKVSLYNENKYIMLTLKSCENIILASTFSEIYTLYNPGADIKETLGEGHPNITAQ